MRLNPNRISGHGPSPMIIVNFGMTLLPLASIAGGVWLTNDLADKIGAKAWLMDAPMLCLMVAASYTALHFVRSSRIYSGYATFSSLLCLLVLGGGS